MELPVVGTLQVSLLVVRDNHHLRAMTARGLIGQTGTSTQICHFSLVKETMSKMFWRANHQCEKKIIRRAARRKRMKQQV
eukprot:scaffold10060_cov141-Skeletonema_menzelii.AAC.8